MHSGPRFRDKLWRRNMKSCYLIISNITALPTKNCTSSIYVTIKKVQIYMEVKVVPTGCEQLLIVRHIVAHFLIILLKVFLLCIIISMYLL